MPRTGFTSYSSCEFRYIELRRRRREKPRYGGPMYMCMYMGCSGLAVKVCDSIPYPRAGVGPTCTPTGVSLCDEPVGEINRSHHTGLWPVYRRPDFRGTTA
ncbi:hypothetical protein M513_12040 [Trichuris suis]|uniref:Beta/gamma crystallin 'Greek key' domain-containing protein n=1 Tax=Trichuris suis TaxID=68888 RepID=A0A085LQ06_9BILA|nr:hypothetical protein M513_12040 [Trichuris suis]